MRKLALRPRLLSANSINSSVDGDAFSKRSTKLDKMLVPGDEPSIKSNFFGFGWL